ncbi:hypothetical protein QYM36_000314 [Artemia franciscana]|uniref:RNA-dependent RNA polymerase n=2 Tax=Artemia franciscana TaxID=6661 RepID=A0AA88IQ82_ARTSF|nr:hypothetical protein QYM36_000314 [Artemia franciscana]
MSKIEAALNNCRALRIEKACLDDTVNNGSSTDEKSALIRFWPCNGLPANYCYDQLCKSWNFKIDNDPGVKIWSALQPSEFSECKRCQVEWQLTSLSFGNFIDKQTCEEVAILKSPPMRFLLRFVNKKSLELEVHERNYSRTVLFDYSFLLDFALIDWKEENVAKLFLPYSSVPSLVVKDDQREYLNLSYRAGLNGLDAKLLQYFSENSVIIFHINLDMNKKPYAGKSLPIMLRNLFHYSGLFPRSVFDTSVYIEPVSSQSLKDLWSKVVKNPDLQLLLWELSVIRTQKNCNAPNTYIKQFLEMSLHLRDTTVLMNKLRSHFFRKPLSSYWIDFASLISSIKEEITDTFIEDKSFSLVTKVRQVTITPTTNIYDPVVNDHKSRLFRNYRKFKFTVVKFRDENLQNLKGVNSFKFVHSILQKGLLLNGEKYHFLITSNSGLRNHNAIFVACDNVNVAAQIRAEIVLNQKEFHSVSLYLSSLCLFCSSDQPTVQVLPENIETVPDIKSVSGDLLTDGAGFLRLSFAMKMSHQLHLNSVPSAFQIRLAGVKEGTKILIRPSMVKFKNNDFTLGVVDYSRFLPVHLNREVITLLESINPSVCHSLHEMLEEALSKEAKSLVQLDMFVKKLKSLPNDWNIDEISKTFNIIGEDFWSEIVRRLFVFGLKNIRNKTKIPVENAAFLFGVADPFQILDDNEVFLQIEKDDCSEPIIIFGEVLIYRNPCLHPGDIRVVQAVNKSEFQMYKNVLILPAKPTCKYSLSAACSGGDLDGDRFSVIWDSRLVPPKSSLVPPFNYAKLKSKMPSCTMPWSLDNLCHFFIKCLSSDMLGQIANLHLALCDQLDKGACDPIAMKLAEAQAYAVDFPKTGILPEVPTDAWYITSTNGYPDFMEKSEKISYISKKIIGQLYHSTLAFDLEASTGSRCDLDLDLIIPGHEDFLMSAKKDYELYSLSLKNIMYQCGFQDEYNLIIGHDPFAVAAQSFPRQKSSLAQKAMDDLKGTFKAKFYDGISTDSDIKAKASAWYKVSYTRAKCGSETFLSFAWLVPDVLCEIKKSKMLPENGFNYEKLLFKEIGASARSYFFENFSVLKQVTAQKTNTGEMIVQLTKDKSLVFLSDAKIHGSIATYTCDSESDINISLLLSRQEASDWRLILNLFLLVKVRDVQL